MDLFGTVEARSFGLGALSRRINGRGTAGVARAEAVWGCLLLAVGGRSGNGVRFVCLGGCFRLGAADQSRPLNDGMDRNRSLTAQRLG